MSTRACCWAAALVCLLVAPSRTLGTWSIIIVDRDSKEIAIGSATCLTSDLKRWVPVVLVDVGAGAAQSYIDIQAANRQRMRAELLVGTNPAKILELLADQDSAPQSRQYGIVDVRGRAATFSGAANGAYANGVTGQYGSLVYSIQGNVLTGQPVLDQAEAAVLYTPGGLPEKLMAAMEAARDMGGDGRCSCDSSDPTGCGSPPEQFDKSAHIGFMIVARRGDVDGVCNRNMGCASGDYYMTFNIKNQPIDAPDPVDQLRELFDEWRAGLVGVPDAAESAITVTPERVLNEGFSTATMRIEIRDWLGAPAVGITDVAVMHDPTGSAGACTIGPLNDLGGGVYEVELSAGTDVGRDFIAVRVTDITGERFLIPSGKLLVQDQRADLNHDGVVDLDDLIIMLLAYGTSAEGDVDGDGDTDISDLGTLLAVY